MIVLFIQSDLVRHQPLPGHICPSCHRTDSMDMELRQRYAEFAGGKVYPKGVFGLATYLHCGYALPASRWDEQLHQAYESLKAGYKTPGSYWKGAMITVVGFALGFALLVGALDFMGLSRRAAIDRQQALFATSLTTPTPGVTLASIANGQPAYDVWRVSKVSGETIWLKIYKGNRMLANFYEETGWATLSDGEFSREAIGYSQAELAKKRLKRTTDLADKNKSYEGVIITILDK